LVVRASQAELSQKPTIAVPGPAGETCGLRRFVQEQMPVELPLLDGCRRLKAQAQQPKGLQATPGATRATMA
jgi:hypothetical protein